MDRNGSYQGHTNNNNKYRGQSNEHRERYMNGFRRTPDNSQDRYGVRPRSVDSRSGRVGYRNNSRNNDSYNYKYYNNNNNYSR